MEERIVDDEYARGVRMKKTENGYVDVTDEQLCEGSEEQDEVEFQFPIMEMDEDDEDLVGLSPEEALALRKQKEEEERLRQEEYASLCAQGAELIKAEQFAEAEQVFERAIQLDDEAVDATVGYWEAKTKCFQEPETLIDEYAEVGVENMEFDLGCRAVDILKERYQSVIRQRADELGAREKELSSAVEGKQQTRREILKGRLKKSGILSLVFGVITAALLAVTLVLGGQIFSTRENVHLVPTIVFAVLTFAALLAFVNVFSGYINVLKLHAKNERLSSTEDGETLQEIRYQLSLYEALIVR